MTRCWIVCYDISDDKRLRRVAKVMERFGDRVQKSVFECWLRETELRSMREAVEREVKIGTDSLRLYPLCENCRQLAKSAGGLDIDEPNDYTIV